MREMKITPFPRKIEIDDVGHLVRTRLSQTIVMWPDQSIPLLGYMCHPNDAESRDALQRTLLGWQWASADNAPTIPKKLGRMQHNWLRVADIINAHSDLIAGQHQARRGGARIGKAIALVAANTESRGTSASSLWKIWSTYKDVAHLVAAATIICAQARIMFRNQPLGQFGLNVNQIISFHMAMLMPDLVLAVALEFERLGLSAVPHSGIEPTLDPETAWRMPPDINVVPLPPPIRKIRVQDIAVLNQRRAGNRGKANSPKTTPVFG